MNSEVLARQTDPDLRIYMVWVPKQRGLERDVSGATLAMRDSRATHFWDASSVLVRGYRDTLKLTEDAWDMYLLFGPDAKWEGSLPPAPAYWSHKLGSKEEPRLNGPWLEGREFLGKLRGVSK
jgi:hypothetical protein